MSEQSQLDALISRYHVEYTSASMIKGSWVELEVRIPKLTKSIFSQIYTKIVEKTVPEVSFTINAIMQDDKQTNKIREMTFDPKTLEKTGTRYYQKEQLLLPVFVKEGVRYPYRVTLNLERPIGEIMIDQNSLIRVRNRRTVRREIDGHKWAYDFTITRAISGTEAAKLKSIKAEHFTPRTDAAWVSHYDNTDGVCFEIEIEYLGPATVDDKLTLPNLLAAVNKACETSEDLQLQLMIYKVAGKLVDSPKFLERFRTHYGLKQLLPQVLVFTKEEYGKFYPPIGMYLTYKADGIRTILYMTEGKIMLINSTLTTIELGANLLKARAMSDIILDCEFISQTHKLLVFDIILYGGTAYYKQNFEQRVGAIAAAVADIAKLTNKFTISAKEYVLLGEDFKTTIPEVYAAAPSDNDGLILVGVGQPYMSTVAYKWKPVEQSTIDFLARRAPTRGLWLFVTIDRNLFEQLGLNWCEHYEKLFPVTEGHKFPIQFSPAVSPNIYQWPEGDPELDGKIVELQFRNNTWHLVKVREDRQADIETGEYYGNGFRIAELTWINIVDEFTLDDLVRGPSGYFGETKREIYKTQIVVNTMMKAAGIKEIAGSEWVMDIGVGHGQDLKRYLDARIGNLIAYDKDRSAIAELSRRRYEIFRKTRGYPIYAIIGDLNATSLNELRAIIAPFHESVAVNAIVSNFACHYFMVAESTQANFVHITSSLVSGGGKIVLTMFDGARVHDLFMSAHINEGESYEIYQGPALKYKLTRKYKSDTLAAAGQQIGVLLPFSSGESYDEYLVNVEALIALYKDHGLHPTGPIRYADSFITEDLRLQLTDDDVKYLSLYSILILVAESQPAR